MFFIVISSNKLKLHVITKVPFYVPTTKLIIKNKIHPKERGVPKKMSCCAIIKKGTRKNEVCGTSVKTDSDTCYRHSKKRREFERERIRSWDTRLLKSCENSDKRKCREFDLDKDWVKLMLEDQLGLCFYCGFSLLLTNGNKLDQQASIDRVDSSKGHLKGNVVLSCWGCNKIKGDRPFEDYTFPRAIEDVLQLLEIKP